MQKVITQSTRVVHFGNMNRYGMVTLNCQRQRPVNGSRASYLEVLTCKRCWPRVYNARLALIALGISIEEYKYILHQSTIRRHSRVREIMTQLDINPEPDSSLPVSPGDDG